MILKLFAEVAGLSAFLFAGVAWLKQFGVYGQKLTACSLVFGILIGMGVRYADSPLVTFPDWFWAAMYGLVCGFVASGAYKGGRAMVQADPVQVTINQAVSPPPETSPDAVQPQ